MASKAPSPLIRSSKAFSVQIPEGIQQRQSAAKWLYYTQDLKLSIRFVLGDEKQINLYFWKLI